VTTDQELRDAYESGDLSKFIKRTGPKPPLVPLPLPLPADTAMRQISVRLPQTLVDMYDHIAANDPRPEIDRSTLIRMAMYHELARRSTVATEEVEHALDVLRTALLGEPA
jgi:hypothetical protein